MDCARFGHTQLGDNTTCLQCRVDLTALPEDEHVELTITPPPEVEAEDE